MHTCKDWCDGESEKKLKFGMHLNRAQFIKQKINARLAEAATTTSPGTCGS
jgi:hypothetical protein